MITRSRFGIVAAATVFGVAALGGCTLQAPSGVEDEEARERFVALLQELRPDARVLGPARTAGSSAADEVSLELDPKRTAELLGLPLMTICSTCQGVIGASALRLRDPEYREYINREYLADQGLEYKGTTEVKHLLWVLVEDVGLENLQARVRRPLSGLGVAPFYGCYILRPSDAPGRALRFLQRVQPLTVDAAGAFGYVRRLRPTGHSGVIDGEYTLSQENGAQDCAPHGSQHRAPLAHAYLHPQGRGSHRFRRQGGCTERTQGSPA